MRLTSILLMVIWVPFYLLFKRKLNTGKVYFFFLFCMITPCLFEPNWMWNWIETEINYLYILFFGFLLLLSFYPWYIFDKQIVKHKCKFEVRQHTVKSLKRLFSIIIILSLYSIIYMLPYAIMGYSLGAAEIRVAIRDKSLLPNSIFTTLAVGFASLNIYCILFFFLSFLSPLLSKYRIWLFISSLSYIVASGATMGRDGLIILPVFYIIFYLLFRNSYSYAVQKRIKKSIIIAICGMGAILSIITASRFYTKGNADDVFSGTIGYITQQPYVFNTTIIKQNDFHGFELRFPLLNRLIGIPQHEVSRTWGYEMQFGTMYSEAYSMFGWSSLLTLAIIFCIYYSFSMRFLLRKSKTFPALLMFTVYIYIIVTGLFYLKAGSSVLNNIFFISLSIIPFFVKNYLKTTYESNYRNTNYSF